MKNWKTTLCGAVAALAVYFETIPDLAFVGKFLLPVAVALGGFFAKDSSSEEAK